MITTLIKARALLKASKDGITTCHRYCTAYVVSNGKPVTLAMTYVRTDEDEADAVERVLARVENYPFEIDLLLADSGFYNERVIRRSREIAATVVHVPKKGERMKDKLDVHKSYITTYRMYKDHERDTQLPLAVAVSYKTVTAASMARSHPRLRRLRRRRPLTETSRTPPQEAFRYRNDISVVAASTRGHDDS